MFIVARLTARQVYRTAAGFPTKASVPPGRYPDLSYLFTVLFSPPPRALAAVGGDGWRTLAQPPCRMAVFPSD